MSGTKIVVVPDGNGAIPRAITKITPMSDGFAVLMPYHSAQTCYLLKAPVDYSIKMAQVCIDECVACEATNRAKLSVHFPGFAQFSGEDSRLITSGRDPQTGEPRGLGIVNGEPFDIRSGPVATIGFWGLQDFKVASSSNGQINLPVSQSFRRDVDIPSRVELLIEVWMLHRGQHRLVADFLGRPMVRMILPQFSGLEFPQDLSVIELPGQDHFLGVQLVRYVGVPRDDDDAYPESGFNVCGPSVLDAAGQYWGLNAFYPRPPDFPAARSLDRAPKTLVTSAAVSEQPTTTGPSKRIRS